MAKPIPEMTANDIARFWASVDVRSPNECWPWKGSKHGKGYGHFSIRPYRMMFKAQRVALAIDGRNPMELHGLHHCDNPPCCNPRHLFVGSNSDNSDDKISKGRAVNLTGDAHYARIKPECLARGTSHGCAKLTEDNVLTIRQSPKPTAELSQFYGVAASTILRIKSRRIWAHLP